MSTAERASTPTRTGTFYGWYIIGISIFGAFLTAGISQAFMGVMLKPMTEDLGWSRTAVSGALTAGTFGSGLLSPFVGRLADRYGPRILAPLGSIVLVTAFFAFAALTELWQFYVMYIIGRSISQTTLTGVVPQTAAANWFRVKRGRALGFISMGLPLGNAILAVVGTAIIDLYGWREVFLVFGVTVLVAYIGPAFLILRRRPEDMGLRPDGVEEPVAASDDSQPATVEEEVSWTLNEALKTRAIWLLTFGLTLGITASGAVGFHQVAYFTDVGIAAGAAAIVLSVYSFSGAAANALWGFMVERFDERNLVMLAMLGAGMAIFGLLFVNSVPTALVFAVVFGLTARGESSLIIMILAQYYGRGSYGAISGFVTPFQMAGLGAGPLIASIIFDLSGTYRGAFVFFACMFLVASFLMLFVRRPVKNEAPAMLA